MPTRAWPAISFSVDGDAAARRVAQDVDGVAAGREEVRDEAVQRAPSRSRASSRTQALAHRHDRDAVDGDRAAHEDDVARRARARGEITTPGGTIADARHVDEDAVALAAVHDLRVARDDRARPRRRRRAASRPTIRPRSAIGRPSSRMKPGRERERLRAAHREVVHRAVDGEGADVAAGEEERAGSTNESVEKRERGRRRPSRIAPSCSLRSAGLSKAAGTNASR